MELGLRHVRLTTSYENATKWTANRLRALCNVFVNCVKEAQVDRRVISEVMKRIDRALSQAIEPKVAGVVKLDPTARYSNI
jgi:hypothetical protein